ncbi:MAG: hypothetical protein GQ554_03305 [Deltaproteobacteria bacterium]|nr:hypothetical protein [Deltaproteobacteria bacterium]
MMEFAQGIVLAVPLWYIAVLLTFMMVCLAFGRYTLGLIGAILFLVYTVYVFNFDKLFNQSFGFNCFTLFLILTGGTIAVSILVIFKYAFSLKD